MERIKLLLNETATSGDGTLEEWPEPASATDDLEEGLSASASLDLTARPLLDAVERMVAHPSPGRSASAGARPSASPGASPTAATRPSGSPVPSPRASPTASPRASPVPSPGASPTAAPRPSGSPVPSPVPSPPSATTSPYLAQSPHESTDVLLSEEEPLGNEGLEESMEEPVGMKANLALARQTTDFSTVAKHAKGVPKGKARGFKRPAAAGGVANARPSKKQL